jgi:hypothetical protein
MGAAGASAIAQSLKTNTRSKQLSYPPDPHKISLQSRQEKSKYISWYVPIPDALMSRYLTLLCPDT